MNISNNEVTTAVVVDCPTPFAPPLVVKPQLQPMTEINSPKKPALTMALKMSHTCRKLLFGYSGISATILHKQLTSDI